MQVGGGLGLAVVSAVAVAQIPPVASAEALLPGYRAAFWTAALVASLGLLTSL